MPPPFRNAIPSSSSGMTTDKIPANQTSRNAKHNISPYSQGYSARTSRRARLTETPSFDASSEGSSGDDTTSDDSSSSYSMDPNSENIDNYNFERLPLPTDSPPSQVSISMGPITSTQLSLHRTHALATIQNYMRVHWERSTFKYLRRRARIEDDSNAEVIRRTGGTGWECRRLMSPEMEERDSGLVPWGPVNGEAGHEPLEFPSSEEHEEGGEGPWLHEINGFVVPFTSDPAGLLPPFVSGYKPPPVPMPVPLYTSASDPLPPRTGFRLDTRKCVDQRAPVRPMPWSNKYHEPEEPSEYLEEYWKWSGREYGYTREDGWEDGVGPEADSEEQDVADRLPEGGGWLPSLPVNLPWPFRA